MKRVVLLFVVSVSVWCAPQDYGMQTVVHGYDIDVNGKIYSYYMWRLIRPWEYDFDTLFTAVENDAKERMKEYGCRLAPIKTRQPFRYVPNHNLSPNVISAMRKYDAVLSRTIFRDETYDYIIWLVYNIDLLTGEFATYVYELEQL